MSKKNISPKLQFIIQTTLAIFVGLAFTFAWVTIVLGNDKSNVETASSTPSTNVMAVPLNTPEPVSTSVPLDYASTEEISLYLSLSAEKQAMLERYSAQAGVDANMVRAICFQESRFQPTLTHTNSNGTVDWGVAQCNDSTFETLQARIGIGSMQELLDFETGIRACCALLEYYKTDLGIGNPNDLLLAYQQGYTGFQNVKNGSAEPWDAYAKTLGSMAIYAGYFTT